MASPKDAVKTISLYNRGPRTYRTTAGDLKPGKSIELPEAEGKSLLDYRDLVDASKAVAGGGDLKKKLAEVTAERDALQAENEKLQADLKAATDLLGNGK